jgi:hypothetical protein
MWMDGWMTFVGGGGQYSSRQVPLVLPQTAPDHSHRKLCRYMSQVVALF